MSSYPCWMARTSCCPPPLCPRPWLSCGSVLERLPLMCTSLRCFSSMLSLWLSQESFWPWHLTTMWPFVLPWDTQSRTTSTEIVKMSPCNLGMKHWDHFPFHIPVEEAAILSDEYHPTLVLWTHWSGQICLCWHHCQRLVWLLSANGISFGRCCTHWYFLDFDRSFLFQDLCYVLNLHHPVWICYSKWP